MLSFFSPFFRRSRIRTQYLSYLKHIWDSNQFHLIANQLSKFRSLIDPVSPFVQISETPKTARPECQRFIVDGIELIWESGYPLTLSLSLCKGTGTNPLPHESRRNFLLRMIVLSLEIVKQCCRWIIPDIVEVIWYSTIQASNIAVNSSHSM